jgi:hypothetical protein
LPLASSRNHFRWISFPLGTCVVSFIAARVYSLG